MLNSLSKKCAKYVTDIYTKKVTGETKIKKIMYSIWVHFFYK